MAGFCEHQTIDDDLKNYAGPNDESAPLEYLVLSVRALYPKGGYDPP